MLGSLERTTKARGTSLPSLEVAPITAASSMAGCFRRTASSSAGATCHLLCHVSINSMIAYLQGKKNVPSDLDQLLSATLDVESAVLDRSNIASPEPPVCILSIVAALVARKHTGASDK